MLLGRAKRADDLALAVLSDIAIARKCREDVLMAEILGPGLVFLRRFADLAAEKRQRFPKAVWVEVWQAGSCERVLEDLADGTGGAPMLALETRCLETAAIPDHDLRCRE